MNRWRTQRGDVPVGCLIGFVVAVVVALIAIKTIPVMVAVGEFDKEVKAYADRASRPDYDDKRIRKDLAAIAGERDIPISAKDIWINRAANRIKIRILVDRDECGRFDSQGDGLPLVLNGWAHTRVGLAIHMQPLSGEESFLVPEAAGR